MRRLDEFLQPTYAIDSDNKAIRDKAREIGGIPGGDPLDIAQRLFYFVRDEIKYNMYVPVELPDDHVASKVLQHGEGYCVQKAVLLTALTRACGIPARLGFADFLNHMLARARPEWEGASMIIYHGFAELWLSGEWVKATPAFDLAMCRKYGIIPVDFDGQHDAVFHPVDQDGNPHIEYIRFHGAFQELPFDRMSAARDKVYGKGYLGLWDNAARTESQPTDR